MDDLIHAGKSTCKNKHVRISKQTCVCICEARNAFCLRWEHLEERGSACAEVGSGRDVMGQKVERSVWAGVRGTEQVGQERPSSAGVSGGGKQNKVGVCAVIPLLLSLSHTLGLRHTRATLCPPLPPFSIFLILISG